MKTTNGRWHYLLEGLDFFSLSTCQRADIGTWIDVGQNSKQVSSKTQGKQTAASAQLSCTRTHTHTKAHTHLGQVHLDTCWDPVFVDHSTWEKLLGYSCALLCSKYKRAGMCAHTHAHNRCAHIHTHSSTTQKNRWKQTALFFSLAIVRRTNYHPFNMYCSNIWRDIWLKEMGGGGGWIMSVPPWIWLGPSSAIISNYMDIPYVVF